MKILFHVDDTDRLSMAATNAANAVKYVQDNELTLEAEIVVNGEAVTGLVRRAACQNALNAHQLSKEDLCDFVTIVPAGVIELAQRQEEGYAYIKP